VPPWLTRSAMMSRWIDAVWDHSTFSKSRDRLLAREIAGWFLDAVLAPPRVKRRLSSDHVSVDGTLIQAWASPKSFRPKDGGSSGGGDHGSDISRNAAVDFKGQKRSNATHASMTDPDALLYRKGSGMQARLRHIGHGRMENRSRRRQAHEGVPPCRATGGAGDDGAVGRAPSRGREKEVDRFDHLTLDDAWHDLVRRLRQRQSDAAVIGGGRVDQCVAGGQINCFGFT